MVSDSMKSTRLGFYYRWSRVTTERTSANCRKTLGRFALSNYGKKLFALLDGGKERQCFTVSRYCSRQTVERRGVLRRAASCYLGVRRQFEQPFYGLICVT